MKKIFTLLMLAILAQLYSCGEPEDLQVYTSGEEADFTKYISIGNSLTSGFMNGDLYLEGQQNSYPSILAHQFEIVGGGTFSQPLMKDNVGFGKKLLLLGITETGPQLSVAGGDPSANLANISAEGPYNNLGVPGARSYHLIAPHYGDATLGYDPNTGKPRYNPYFARFTNSAEATIMSHVPADFTFFSLWIGNNDVLGYATTGGASVAAGDSITSPPFYAYVLNTVLAQLTANGQKGVIANIPDVTSIPFFTTMTENVTYNGLNLTQDQANMLNFAYAATEAYLQSIGVTYSYGFNFTEGLNAFVVEDPEFPIAALPAALKVKQMQAGDMFLLTLPVDSLLNYGMGSFNSTTFMPYGIPHKYILDLNEQAQVQAAVNQYNQIIADLADTYGLALADMNGFMNQLASEEGITMGGNKFTSDFITGSAFSLDGVHPTGQGYAILSNIFIEAINEKYNSKIPRVWVTDYLGL